MSVRRAIATEFGENALRRAVSAGELYDAIDALTEAFTGMKKRIDELEAAPIRYRGVWQRTEEYSRGSVVTDQGSAWHAIRDTSPGERPSAADSWQLMVKAGRNGKDAR